MSEIKTQNPSLKNSKNKRFISNNHTFKKRAPAKLFQRDNDIYVTNKTDFNVSFELLQKNI
jgi:hypothetical protein